MKRKPGIDESLEFYPLNIAVLTVSDSRTEETDTSGGLLIERAKESGHTLVDRAIVKDEVSDIRAVVTRWIADP
ncbi:molybdopterin-binding protein, partial [Hyphomonas sp.]